MSLSSLAPPLGEGERASNLLAHSPQMLGLRPPAGACSSGAPPVVRTRVPGRSSVGSAAHRPHHNAGSCMQRHLLGPFQRPASLVSLSILILHSCGGDSEVPREYTACSVSRSTWSVSQRFSFRFSPKVPLTFPFAPSTNDPSEAPEVQKSWGGGLLSSLKDVFIPASH